MSHLQSPLKKKTADPRSLIHKRSFPNTHASDPFPYALVAWQKRRLEDLKTRSQETRERDRPAFYALFAEFAGEETRSDGKEAFFRDRDRESRGARRSLRARAPDNCRWKENTLGFWEFLSLRECDTLHRYRRTAWQIDSFSKWKRKQLKWETVIVGGITSP